MLTINKSKNASSAIGYFNSGLTQEGDYYMEDVPAYWAGKAAEHLGIHDTQVTPEVFTNLVRNRMPFDSKNRLTVLDKSDRKAGIDFTFSAPKSVSVAYSITKDQVILTAHRRAYRAAMREIERHMQTQANTQNERRFAHTGNLVYAAFDHFTSRPVATDINGKTEYVPDIQIHTHCYVPNVTWVAGKNRYQAIETVNIHRQAMYFEAYYHAYLSHALNEAGYHTERNNERYEIKGVSRDIIERFSNRTRIIEGYAQDHNITDAKAKGELGVKTRRAKTQSIGKDRLHEHWRNRLSDKELEVIQNLKGKYKPMSQLISAKRAIDLSLAHFLERNSVIEEKRVLAHALKLGYGQSLLPKAVGDELKSRSNVLWGDDRTVPVITTKEMVRHENRLIHLATSGKGQFRPANPNFQPLQDFLNQGQRQAISDVLNSQDQVTVLEGKAGSGKSTVLGILKEGIAETGKTMFAVAPSSQATDVLRKEGYDANTIAGLLSNSEKQQRLKDNWLCVDEASMCGIKTLTEILTIAKKQNCRVLLSGDTKQLGPPGQYGDALRILKEQADLKTARIQQIMRQKPKDYRKAVENIGAGRVLKGYQLLDQMGAIQEIEDRDERLEKIAETYKESINAKRSALIVSPTNYEGDLLTQIVRQKLKSDGHLKGAEKTFDTLRDQAFTLSEKQDWMNYQDGMVVRFIRNQPGGFKAGSHYEIVSQDKTKGVQVKDMHSGDVSFLPFKSAEHFHVYSKNTTKLQVGDLIRPTVNLKSLQGTKVNNGTAQKVAGFSKDGIQLTTGKTLSKNCLHFKHSYVETTYSAQGKTAHDVIVSMSDDSFTAVNDQVFYVSVSRGRTSIQLITSEKNSLKQAIARSGERTTAREVAQEHERRLMERRQRDYYNEQKRTIKDHGLYKQRNRPSKGHLPERFSNR